MCENKESKYMVKPSRFLLHSNAALAVSRFQSHQFASGVPRSRKNSNKLPVRILVSSSRSWPVWYWKSLLVAPPAARWQTPTRSCVATFLRSVWRRNAFECFNFSHLGGAAKTPLCRHRCINKPMGRSPSLRLGKSYVKSSKQNDSTPPAFIRRNTRGNVRSVGEVVVWTRLYKFFDG